MFPVRVRVPCSQTASSSWERGFLLLQAQRPFVVNSPAVSVNVNFGRGDGCRKSSLLILISRRAGQELQLSLKRSLVISEFGPGGRRRKPRRERGSTLPGHLPLLREHTVIAEPCLRRKGRITTCSPRRENKQPSVSGGGDSFKGYSRGLKPKEVPSRASWKSVLSLLLGLPVSGYQSLPAGFWVLGSLPTSPTSDPKNGQGNHP